MDHSPSFPAFCGACHSSLTCPLCAMRSRVSAQSDMPKHAADLIISNITGHCYGQRRCQTWGASSCEQLGPAQYHEHGWRIRNEDVRCLWRFEKSGVRAMQGNAGQCTSSLPKGGQIFSEKSKQSKVHVGWRSSLSGRSCLRATSDFEVLRLLSWFGCRNRLVGTLELSRALAGCYAGARQAMYTSRLNCRYQ